VPAYPDELWRSVADLSGLLLSEEDQETTLRRVGDLAVRSIPSCDAVGVTLRNVEGSSTRAATGGLVYEVDQYQYEVGEGPCLEAVSTRSIVEVKDMATEERWPSFARHAADRGIHSSLSLPMVVRGEPLGALNLYAFRSGAFDESSRQTGAMFAAQAAVVVANAQTYAASVSLTQELRQALDSRATIDQAIGILMARTGCSDETAFDQLRVRSQSTNRKLREVAADLIREVTSGGAPPV
jgi:GAF domain-containing protein